MKRTPCYLVAAAIASALASSPACADEAASATGGDVSAGTVLVVAEVIPSTSSAPTLGALDSLYSTATPTVSDSSLTAATTVATSPMSTYYSAAGVDTTHSGTTTTSTAGGSVTSTSGTASTVTQASAQPPDLSLAAMGASYVGSGSSIGTSDAGTPAPAGTSAPLTTSTTSSPLAPADQTPVPAPSALFLLGSGLFALLPSRPTLRRAV